MSGSSFTAEWELGAMEALERLVDPGRFLDALDEAASELALLAERTAKEATPQVTGNARRTTVSKVDGKDKAVLGRYPYLGWLDTGKDERGRKMQTRPGGYRIRSQTMDAARRAAPGVLDRVGREALGKALD